jgi:NADH-quinone oxidoreductase subunit E
MQRYDLRHLKADFYGRMEAILDEMAPEEVGIFMFEVGDFSPVHESAKRVNELGHELLNSIKYNEVDWTIVVKKKAKA